MGLTKIPINISDQAILGFSFHINSSLQMGQRGLKGPEPLHCKGRCQKLLSGFGPLRGGEPPLSAKEKNLLFFTHIPLPASKFATDFGNFNSKFLKIFKFTKFWKKNSQIQIFFPKFPKSQRGRHCHQRGRRLLTSQL